MTLLKRSIKDLTVDLFLQESERDKQRKVGASQISDPCTRHLAKALIGEKEPPAKYWLGGKIGTAIHSFIENAIDTSTEHIFSDAIVERKIELGYIDGYGGISSKPDLVLPSINHLIDWKTSSRKKVKLIKDLVDGIKQSPASEYTLQKYIGQTQLYAWGLNQAGTKIDDITIVFINRDGTYAEDIWTYSIPYEGQIAIALWDRLVALWNELQDGAHPDNYPPNEHCFKCSMGI